jgi:hypothetical protein
MGCLPQTSMSFTAMAAVGRVGLRRIGDLLANWRLLEKR